jgi:hypothetical protein
MPRFDPLIIFFGAVGVGFVAGGIALAAVTTNISLGAGVMVFGGFTIGASAFSEARRQARATRVVQQSIALIDGAVAVEVEGLQEGRKARASNALRRRDAVDDEVEAIPEEKDQERRDSFMRGEGMVGFLPAIPEEKSADLEEEKDDDPSDKPSSPVVAALGRNVTNYGNAK